MSKVNHAEWLKQLLTRDPIYQGLLKRRQSELYDEAQRILKGGYVKWIESDRDGRLYFVVPPHALYKVKEMKDGSWICLCENFSRYGICEHILSVQMNEK